MIGRRHRSFVGDAEDDLRSPQSEDSCQCDSCRERVEQTSVRQRERLPRVNAQNARRFARLSQSHFDAGTAGSRLAIREVYNTDAIPLLNQPRERSANGDFDIIGMCSNGDDIKRRGKFGRHGSKFFSCGKGRGTGKERLEKFDQSVRVRQRRVHSR